MAEVTINNVTESYIGDLKEDVNIEIRLFDARVHLVVKCSYDKDKKEDGAQLEVIQREWGMDTVADLIISKEIPARANS